MGYNFRLALMVAQNSAQVEAQHYSQVQQRVYEKVDNFMSLPVTALRIFHDFFESGGFPNNLQATDRDLAVTYLYSLLTGFDGVFLEPYYGLENGLLLGYWPGTVPLLVYREPGNSGFPLGDGSNLQMYLNTCVDSETGTEEKCLSDKGSLYISCVNECAMVKCQDSQSTADCALLTDPIEQNECKNNIAWCQNYTIEEAQGDEGFVPTTYSCIDKYGAFSQTRGQVLVETPEGNVQQGDCTFGSGAVVTRSLAGRFAYCATEPHGKCNTTFVGGHTSRNYDPRWRPWYIASRREQRPMFSDLYVFFRFKHLGITYTSPIFERDNQGRKTFAGVMAVDIVLNDISNFLAQAFNQTEFSVAIYEDQEPHSIIGVSTGSKVVSMIHEETKQECSGEQIYKGECTATQLTIQDLGSSKEDIILRKAHLLLKETELEIISIWDNEEQRDSTAYLATSVVYEQPGANLNWRIVVVAPLEKNSENFVTEDEGLFVLVCIIGILGFLLCSSLFVLFYRQRNERAVLLADFKFTSAFILGCAVVNLSTLTLLGENTDQLCLLRMWAFFMLSSIVLSPLYVKAYRTWKLLGTSMPSAVNVRMNNYQAFLRTLPIPTFQAIILTIITFVDPPLATTDLDLDSASPTLNVSCMHDTDLFLIIQSVFDILLLVTGCILAYLTRNIDPQFGDAKALLFAMYNVAFTTLMLAVIFAAVDITETSACVLRAVGVFWATVFSSAAFILPRLMTARKERFEKEASMTRLRLTKKASSTKISYREVANANVHGSDESLNILVCSANIGNAAPTLSSMKAWIPEEGSCSGAKPLSGERIGAAKFDMIVIGMQEATWSFKKGKEDRPDGTIMKNQSYNNTKRSNSDGTVTDEISDKKTENDVVLAMPITETESSPSGVRNEEENHPAAVRVNGEDATDNNGKTKEEQYLAAVEGEDTVALRKMVKDLLGEDYTAMAQEVRGQMRLHVWALKKVGPFIEDLKISGANTGIGNVLANKGGIVISLKYQSTRLTFLSAHLAAHEGESFYKSRCDNLCDILRSSKTFDLSKRIDLSISSHHIFVLGDLNFRTKFDGNNKHEDNFKRALQMVEAKDWSSLYSFDELHKGIELGHLLVGFDTLPCNFNPTFKVKRAFDFVYNEQRTPSYTDRILFRSAPNLGSNLKALAYEPCVDFITSDHKPIRGVFSLVPNDIIEPKAIQGKFRLVFSNMECSELLAGDVDGLSDPYVMILWDSIDMVVDGRGRFSWMGGSKWPRTDHKSKTLNPKWTGKEISLVSSSHYINAEAMLHVCVYDYDFMSDDDILGTLPLSIQELVSMETGQTRKEIVFDQPLERYGKFGGRIRLKLEVSILVGQ